MLKAKKILFYLFDFLFFIMVWELLKLKINEPIAFIIAAIMSITCNVVIKKIFSKKDSQNKVQ